MSELPELTGPQREAAIERAGDSIALTSGAGCGKTLVLARRFTELIMAAGGLRQTQSSRAGEADKNPFDNFVALTFTDKAAAEMVRRVRDVLMNIMAGSDSEDDRRKIADWIIELPAARISTIHSFCASLLRRYAIEAGVDPGFSVCADELLAGQMRTRSVEDAVLSAVEVGDANVLELMSRTEMSGILADVETLLKQRGTWRDEDYSDPEKTLGRWRKRQEQSRRDKLTGLAEDENLRDEMNRLAGYPCREPDDKLFVYRERTLDVISQILQQPDTVQYEDISSLRSPGNIGGAKAWGGKDQRKAYRQKLKAFVEKFAELATYFRTMGDADADAAQCLAVLTKLAGLADELYAQQKRLAGMLDFDDLIDLTARLIRDNRHVRRSIGGNIDQMLIDECQDTDATQLRMLWGLLSDDKASDSLPKSSKICIIGDLKQSIYRFRGAQAEVFEQLCSRFGGNRVLLDKSFRTHRAGAAFVNETFSRLMSGYEPIVSSRTELPPVPGVEILLTQCADDTNAEAAADAQAELVAQRIGEIIDGREKIVFDKQANKWRPAEPGDFAVLFARMTTSLRYEYALQRRDLPYYVVGGVGFFSRQEVYDVLNSLRVIDNTFDDIALFGLLRSAMLGLDDNVLLHIASAIGPPYFDKLTDEAVLNGLTEPQVRQLRFAHELLARLHREKDALGPAAIIEEVLEQTGYQAVLLSQFHGRRKLGNVLQLLDAARSAQATGKISLADFIRRYDEYITDQSRHEQAAVADETDDVIRIMTVHKAKGLEFPIVIIPDLNVGSHKIRDRILFHPDWSVTCKPPGIMDEDEQSDKSGDEEPVSFSLAKEAEKQSAYEEDVRRFYVAATRHQDHLILVGSDRRNKDGQFKDKGSCLAMLDDVFGIADAIDAEAEAIEYGSGFSIRLARVEPVRPAGGKRKISPVPQLIAAAANAEKVADALASTGKNAGAEKLNLIGPLPDAVGGGTVAATALADFGYCPMLYRWRHELRVPSTGKKTTSATQTRLDAATTGTFFHRCMELVDFGDIASVQAEALAGRVAAEMELTVPAEPLGRELSDMLNRLAQTPLMKQLTEAQQRLAELSFVYRAGNTDITGQIDLLYQDAEGAWHVVDYKSDRIAPEQASEHAMRYELQMMVYLAAAGRAFETEIADATVYFLRAGVSHRFGATSETIAAAQQRLAHLTTKLVHCRRAGQFGRISDTDKSLCKSCTYAKLCSR